MKTYTDKSGKQFTEDQIARDFMGRNRERALQLLAENRDDPRGGRQRWGINVEADNQVGVVRVTRALPQTD
jgi:hypothetical protein